MSRLVNPMMKRPLAPSEFEVFKYNITAWTPMFPYDNFEVVKSWQLIRYYNVGCSVLYLQDHEGSEYVGFVPCNTFLCPVLDVKRGYR